MTIQNIALQLLHFLGPQGGVILFVVAIILVIELEQLIQHFIKRVRKNCPPARTKKKDKPFYCK